MLFILLKNKFKYLNNKYEHRLNKLVYLIHGMNKLKVKNRDYILK